MATTKTHQRQQKTQTKPTDLIKERGSVKKRERERQMNKRESKRGEGGRLSLRDEREGD